MKSKLKDKGSAGSGGLLKLSRSTRRTTNRWSILFFLLPSSPLSSRKVDCTTYLSKNRTSWVRSCLAIIQSSLYPVVWLFSVSLSSSDFPSHTLFSGHDHLQLFGTAQASAAKISCLTMNLGGSEGSYEKIPSSFKSLQNYGATDRSLSSQAFHLYF